MTGDPPDTGADATSPPRTFWLALVPGVLMIGYGVRGLFGDTSSAALWSTARWFVGGNLAQDLLVAPLACLVGHLLARRLPALARGPAQAGFVACGILGLVAFPFVRGYGRTVGEPSFLARDYGASLLTLWAMVWAVAVVVVAARVTRRSRS